MSSHSGNASEDASVSCFNSSTSKDKNRTVPISTSNESGGTGPYEVVCTENITEFEVYDEIFTLLYAVDGTNTTLSNEVSAAGRGNSKSQGGVRRSLSIGTVR